MSNLVISAAWGFKKTPRFNTTAQKTAAAQGSVYVANQLYPIWDFSFEIPYLNGRIDNPASNVAQLLGLFVAAKGRAGTFLFSDPRDNTVTNFQFGTGDGASQSFQLTRSIGGLATDIVQNLNGAPTIQINGVTTAAYSISNGIVTFNTAPAANAALTWTGSFYFLLRFKEDSLADLSLFFESSWELRTLDFESVIL